MNDKGSEADAYWWGVHLSKCPAAGRKEPTKQELLLEKIEHEFLYEQNHELEED